MTNYELARRIELNIEEQHNGKKIFNIKLGNLSSMFFWGSTKEGYDFWRNIFKNNPMFRSGVETFNFVVKNYFLCKKNTFRYILLEYYRK